MNFKILAIGGVLQEIIYNTDGANVIQSGSRRRAEKMIAVSYGSKISSNQVWRSFGGGALNSLATFRSLGLAAAPVSVVGDDLAGYEIRHYLARQKVYTKLVAIDKNRETAFSFVLNLPKDKEHVVFVSQGALNEFRFPKTTVQRQRVEWFFLTSLRGRMANSNLREIFLLARAKAVKIFWNPGQQQLDNFSQYRRYLPQVNFLSLNASEATALTAKLKLKVKTPGALVKYLLAAGCQGVIITQGERGAELYTKDKIYRHSGKKVTVVNTTGAGDAFNAGFLSGYLLHQQDCRAALNLGVNNAVAVIQTLGAHQGVLTKKDL